VAEAEPRVSVAIVTRDREQRLAALLGSLRRQTLGTRAFEVVVVDDGSSDGTAELLERESRRGDLSLIVKRGRGAGIPAARNVAWRAARGKVVAFTDDDCEAAPSWLEAGVAECERNPEAFVQGTTLPHPDELDQRGPFSRTLNIRRLGPWFQTCNMLYPRELLERIGGFDERLAQSGEDADLAWRAIRAGGTPVFAEDAVVLHAVENLGPLGHLRITFRWRDSFLSYKRHPELRREVARYGVFWKTSHALLAQAALGLVLSRWWRPARFLAWAYLDHVLVSRPRWAGASRLAAPYFVLHDLVELYTAVRGAIRNRVAFF